MNNTTYDQRKAEAFAGQLLQAINGGFTAIATGIGSRTGLFDTMAELPPSTSTQIASRAGLNERYVREWLGAMVTAKIVEYEPDHQTYFLPPEHAAFLTTASGPDNLGVFASIVPIVSKTVEKVTDCFHHGGGVSYDHFGQCLHCISETTEAFVDKYLLKGVLPLVPGLTERLEAGITVLDVGCGHGHTLNVMAKAFPKSRFTGYDFVPESIAHAQQEARAMGCTNTTFKVLDVAEMDEVEKYDLITAFDAIHDQAWPRKVLANIYRALRHEGIFLMADINASSRLEENMDHPLAPTFYTISFSHCMTVSLAAGGEGLGTMWGQQKAVELLEAAGFSNPEIKELDGDLFNCYYLSYKNNKI